ncbi:hypothetical protein EON77_01240 [bacterium]|nr:MAG: hypothetical protein EON77_01240 [bacterium]
MCYNLRAMSRVRHATIGGAILLLGGLLSGSALAGTLTVTSPTTGSFVGTGASVTFNITGARVKTTVKAVITSPTGSTTVQNDFTPSTEGTASGTLSLGLAASSPQGQYTIVVSATEPNNTYSPTTLTVNVDTVSPKILSFTPARNSFVKGSVRIRYGLQEANLRDATITAAGQTLPNTGTGSNVEATFDTATITSDGPQTISLSARDQANNTLNDTISVTVDRNAPSSTIQSPVAGIRVRPNTEIAVIVDVADQFSNSVDVTGVDVVLQRTDGTFITRATRLSFRPVANGSSTSRWTGRLRPGTVKLPSTYKIVVSAIDRAGNVAARQELTVRS